MTGTSLIFGTRSNELGAGVLTTASGTASITTGTTSASSGAKDAGAVTVINSVSGAGHTHYSESSYVCLIILLKHRMKYGIYKI